MPMPGVRDGSESPVDRAALKAAIDTLLDRYRRHPMMLATVEFWLHDETPRRSHRRWDNTPRWRGWLLTSFVELDATTSPARTAPTDLVLTTEGLWLRSPLVYSAYGRRIASHLDRAELDDLHSSDRLDLQQLLDTLHHLTNNT